ncbi:hypothetical protein NEF87_001132 [Candidatus Lokiarchaeum ossiferum]|uniref:Peptidase M28 domain-containing protein n=1 Tax=Candidatus Lokiarchaeum ossiferum TaxID=2951803 RepID=A0ABY6HPM4_9ARCH|nr:hypothetical protein NEF87_001132 [Candidatus Lokiarchaeum sp. B-35]
MTYKTLVHTEIYNHIEDQKTNIRTIYPKLLDTTVMIHTTDAKDALTFTSDIIDDFGPRLTGTTACEKAGDAIHANLSKYCDTTTKEQFETCPNSFMAFMKIFGIVYVCFSSLLLIGRAGIYLAALGFSFATLYAYLHFVQYKETFNFLFKKKSGTNIIGKISPKNEIKRRVIVAGHHDSAKVMNFMANPKLQKWYGPRIITGLLIFFGINGLLLAWAIIDIFTGTIPQFVNYLPLILLVGSPAVLQFYFFNSKEVSPGAGDNMIAVAITCKLAELYGTAKKAGKNPLNHTELVFISFDSEEAGIRGSRAYVKHHLKELRSVPTFLFNMDSIYHVDELSFLQSDLNQIVKLSDSMIEDCQKIAQELGYPTTKGKIAWGGGATDAAEFGRHGIEATTLLGMENHVIRDHLVYHTMEDTPDKIELEAVLASLQIANQYILSKDEIISSS